MIEEFDVLADSVEQFGAWFVLVGSLMVILSILNYLLRSVSGRANLGEMVMSVVTGILIAALPQLLTVGTDALNQLSGYSDSRADKETSVPEPDVTTSSPAASSDWSWVPGALSIAGAIAGALVVGVGLFYFYSRFIRPSLTKSRAEAQSAATLVSEARKTLEWVVLDSASYETDLAKQIDYPMMTDVSEKLVGKYVREMRHVQELERALAKKPLLSDAQYFSNAVTDLKVSYEAAVRKAERVRWNSFTFAEQKRLKDARIALDVVQDSSTTPEQRNAQYRRIAKLLDGLIVLTEPVKQSLSAWVPMLTLETGKQAVSTGDEKVLVSAR